MRALYAVCTVSMHSVQVGLSVCLSVGHKAWGVPPRPVLVFVGDRLPLSLAKHFAHDRTDFDRCCPVTSVRIWFMRNLHKFESISTSIRCYNTVVRMHMHAQADADTNVDAKAIYCKCLPSLLKNKSHTYIYIHTQVQTHNSHTLTIYLTRREKPARSKTYFEHPPHTTAPQNRQWCLRRNTVNVRLHDLSKTKPSKSVSE